LRRVCLILLTSLLIFSTTAFSQTRRRSSSTRKPTPAASTASILEARRAGATRVAEQIKNLTKFLYIYGSVAKDIQGVDAAIKRGESSQTALDQVAKSKATIRTSLINVRDGLDKLETDFSNTPALQGYYPRLAGAAAGATRALQLAESGQYDASGRVLLDVVNRLTDVLLAMR
jgi:hypothetical protein